MVFRETFVMALALLAVANAIPMSFRKELPFDEVVPITPFRDDVDKIDYRLPNQTVPLRYDISLTTNVHNAGDAEFTGNVRITILAVEATNVITLHSRQQTIVKIDLYLAAAPTAPIQTDIAYTKTEDVEFLNVPVTTPLAAGQQYIVDITYTGLLRDDNMGFYRSSYKNAAGETVWIATTQFEQTDARHAFPCYDEPQIRAVFSIEIKHDKSYSAISNWPVATSTDSDGNNVITKFGDTEKVQTYLIAFVVSDFKAIFNEAAKIQGVYAKPQSIDAGEAKEALDAGQKILDKFVEHLGVEYSPPKIDQVAVPDFDAGAMENWGLVTYREEYLLYNEKISTTRQLENVRTIIAHEYAHQWFGNHVSPKWWSYLWLNEGFATLYENYLTSLVYPEDRLMDTFVVDSVQTVLEVDASADIRPMTYYVENPDRISGLFDRVAYDKSGSVLRMMQVALGVETWTAGLKNYLDAMKFESASSDDLYAGLQTAVDAANPTNKLDVATIMKSWENQAGYPVITVSRNASGITLQQDRFHYTNATSENRWWVPINYVVGSNPNFTVTAPDTWIEATHHLTISNDTATKKWTSADWVVVNIQENSYFRVNYDDNLWELLINQLNGDGYTQIHNLNRAQLVDDSLNLARAGKIKYAVSLEILSYLSRELDYIPWASANRGLTLLNRLLTGSTAYVNYQKFVQSIVAPLFTKFGVEVVDKEPKLDRYARQVAINLACQAGLESCLTKTAEKLQEVVSGKTIVHPDLQSAIYCNGLRQANKTTFDFMLEKMFASEDQAERTLIIAALGCSSNNETLTSYLALAIKEGDDLRLQERTRVLVAPVNNGELGLRVMLSFIKENYAAIIEIAPNHVFTMLSNIASRIATDEMDAELNLVLNHLIEKEILTSATALPYRKSADVQIDWKTEYLEQVASWLEVATTPTTTTPAGAGSVVVSAIALVSCLFIKYFI